MNAIESWLPRLVSGEVVNPDFGFELGMDTIKEPGFKACFNIKTVFRTVLLNPPIAKI